MDGEEAVTFEATSGPVADNRPTDGSRDSHSRVDATGGQTDQPQAGSSTGLEEGPSGHPSQGVGPAVGPSVEGPVMTGKPWQRPKREPKKRIRKPRPKKVAQPPPAAPSEPLLSPKNYLLPKFTFIQTSFGSDFYRLERGYVAVPPELEESIKSVPNNVLTNGMIKETQVVTSPFPERIAVYNTGLIQPGSKPSSLVLLNPTVLTSALQTQNEVPVELQPEDALPSVQTVISTPQGLVMVSKPAVVPVPPQESVEPKIVTKGKRKRKKYSPEIPRPKKFKCRICGRGFRDTQIQIKHEATHETKSVVCSECGLKMANKSLLEKHILAKHSGTEPQFKCDQCDRAYHIEGHLKNHIAAKHQERNNSTNICEYCGKSYTTIKCLEVHVYRVHKPDNIPEEFQKLKCPDCDYIAPYNKALTAHIRIHTGEKPYKCSQCDASFRMNKHLLDHMRVHTKEELPLKCQQCEKRFSRYSKLRVHVDKEHLQTPRYECMGCERKFYVYSDMMRHFRREHVGVRSHACDSCGASFFEKHELSAHMKTHETGQRGSLGRRCKKASPRKRYESHSEETSDEIETEIEDDEDSSGSHSPPEQILPRLISEILNS